MLTSNNIVLKNEPWITPEKCHEILDRLDSLKSPIEQVNQAIRMIGYPYYFSALKKAARDEQAIKEHNQFMKQNFSDLLEEIKHFFSKHLGESVFYSDKVSMPGFHRIQVAPNSFIMPRLHVDDMSYVIFTERPELKINPYDFEISFTVLLKEEAGLEAGMACFFNEYSKNDLNDLNEKLLKCNLSQLKEIIHIQTYKLGEMNIQKKIIHSIFAHNSSNEMKERVTLQGHLTKTNQGWLAFW